MSRFAAICLGVLVCASLLAGAAQAAVIVHSAADLTKDKKVGAIYDTYRALSAATAVYSKCADMYGLKPEQIAFQKQAFTQVAAQYMQAFHDAYVARVGAEPEQAMANDYTALASKQERDTVNETAQYIDQKSCANNRITKLAEYVDKLHYADSVAKANAAAKEAAKHNIVPASPMDSTPATQQVITPTQGSN